MLDLSSMANFLGRFLLSFYFLKAGVNNALNWSNVSRVIATKHIPLPNSALLGVILIQLLGSLALLFNYYTPLACFALILFTLTANFIFCNYWSMDNASKKQFSIVFYANLAITGSLMLLMTTH